ncbi:MAG: T9SS type A sorting domain-containing protein, partial [Bacteroidota bacterium]
DEFEDISTVKVYNRSNRELQLLWDKQIEGKPGAWELLFCSKSPNFAPFRNTLNSNLEEDRHPIRIGPGEEAEFYLILRPNGEVGKCRVKVPFSSLAQPGHQIGSAIFDLKVSRRAEGATSTTTGRKSLRVYPNPAIEQFYVETPNSIKLGKVEVYNTLGRKIKTFDRPPGPDGYPIDELPEGIYLINLYDDHGKKLRTLRLFHRRFGA